MRIDPELKLGFKDVLIRPKRSTITSRNEVILERSFTLPHSKRSWRGIPLIAANMDSVGTFSMARTLAQVGLATAIHKHYQLQQWQQFLAKADDQLLNHILVSCGSSDNDYQKLIDILALDSRLSLICIDVANGYSESFINFIDKVRQKYPHHGIAAGNTVTGEITEQLILSGADIVKIGLGPGSVCTTRLKTGVGYPQLSAIIECADAAHGLGGLIIADGGCNSPGDVAKAFGAGADFTMLGGMLAAHDEAESEIIEENGQQWVKFHGMSSSEAMQQHSGRIANYRASEGKDVLLPYRGAVSDSLNDILGGLRSACSYVGARQLKELSKRTTFIRVTEQENTIFS